jgi:aryl-alcohol dehydrogenase-like predicted oxidoreductase
MKLALGTAQFGLNYGISNQGGQTPIQEVRRILELAKHAGIDTLDTAHLYGESETILGDLHKLTRSFRVVTKTPILSGNSISDADIGIFNKALERSLNCLRRDSVTGILVHKANDLLAINGERLYQWLVDMRSAGKTTKIGVSIYTPEQAIGLLDRYDFDMLQAPLNLLDRRIMTTGLIDRLRARGMEIHVRSAFLQGLFFMHPSEIPESLAQARPFVEAIQQRAGDIGVSISALALSFLQRQSQVDRIVLGVDKAEQLATNLQAYATPIEDARVFDGLACEDLSVIDPSTWRISR